MEEQYFKNISIEEISTRCHMSSSSFWRMFKKESGLSPMEYLMNIRMKKAVEQLQLTRLPVLRMHPDSVRCSKRNIVVRRMDSGTGKISPRPKLQSRSGIRIQPSQRLH